MSKRLGVVEVVRRWCMRLAIVAGLLLAVGSRNHGAEATSQRRVHVPVVFSRGHETDPRDGGRPVALVAGALAVTPEVFRDAFSRVQPAAAGTEPRPSEVRRNKAVLLQVLAPLGVSNDELDKVSNYYRYNPQRGEMWPTNPATAYAIVENGTVTCIVVTSSGNGYNSPPVVSVRGFPGVIAIAQLGFDKDLQKNGSVRAITIENTKKRGL